MLHSPNKLASLCSPHHKSPVKPVTTTQPSLLPAAAIATVLPQALQYESVQSDVVTAHLRASGEFAKLGRQDLALHHATMALAESKTGDELLGPVSVQKPATDDCVESVLPKLDHKPKSPTYHRQHSDRGNVSRSATAALLNGVKPAQVHSTTVGEVHGDAHDAHGNVVIPFTETIKRADVLSQCNTVPPVLKDHASIDPYSRDDNVTVMPEAWSASAAAVSVSPQQTQRKPTSGISRPTSASFRHLSHSQHGLTLNMEILQVNALDYRSPTPSYLRSTVTSRVRRVENPMVYRSTAAADDCDAYHQEGDGGTLPHSPLVRPRSPSKSLHRSSKQNVLLSPDGMVPFCPRVQGVVRRPATALLRRESSSRQLPSARQYQHPYASRRHKSDAVRGCCELEPYSAPVTPLQSARGTVGAWNTGSSSHSTRSAAATSPHAVYKAAERRSAASEQRTRLLHSLNEALATPLRALTR